MYHRPIRRSSKLYQHLCGNYSQGRKRERVRCSAVQSGFDHSLIGLSAILKSPEPTNSDIASKVVVLTYQRLVADSESRSAEGFPPKE